MVTRREFLASLGSGVAGAAVGFNRGRASADPYDAAAIMPALGRGVVHLVEDYRGTNTEKWQAAIDSAHAGAAARGSRGGGWVVGAPGKVYKGMTPLDLKPGVGIELNGGVLQMADGQPNFTRLLTTQNTLWSDATESPLTVIRGGTIDGNRAGQGAYTGYEKEQSHLIFLMGDSALPGRLRVHLEDLVLRDAVADGVSVYTNVHLTFHNLRCVDCFRGGLTSTGGYSIIQGDLYSGMGSTHPSGLHFETDGAGYGGSSAVEVQITNAICDGDFDLAVGAHSDVQMVNVRSRRPNFYLNGSGSARIRIQHASFAVGPHDNSVNRIVSPGDCVLEDVEFIAVPASGGEGSSHSPVRLYWNVATAYTGQRLQLLNCRWRAAGEMRTDDRLSAVEVAGASALGDDNRLTLVNPEIPDDYDYGVYINQGARVAIHGGHNRAAVPIWWSQSLGYHVDLQVDGMNNRGAGSWMHVNNQHPGSTLRTVNVTVEEADAGISTTGGVAENVYLGGRVILVDSDPTGRLDGLEGDIARLKSPIDNRTYEWVCTSGAAGSAARWQRKATLAP